MSKSILLLSDHPDDATFLAEVAAKTQSQLIVVSNADQVAETILKNGAHTIFLDVSKIEKLREFEAVIQKKIGLFSDAIRPEHIYMVSEGELSSSREVVLSPFFSHFYQRPTHEVSLNGEYFGRCVLASQNIEQHALKNFLGEQAEVQNVELDHTTQKQEAVEAVRQYLISAKIPARIANVIANSVDELLMNAMFDAPTDEFGKALFSATSRTQERELRGRERVAMSIGFDGFYVGINVTDHFGSIDRQRLLNHVSANYKDRDYTVKQGQAGAGLGLANVYNSGASLTYHCEVRKKTEVTLLYRAFPTYREFKSQFKFFSAKFYV